MDFNVPPNETVPLNEETRDEFGNLGGNEQLPSTEAGQVNLDGRARLPSAATDASNITFRTTRTHAANPEDNPGNGGALSTDNPNHPSVVDSLRLSFSSSPVTYISGNKFQERTAQILVDQSLGLLQDYLRVDPNNISIPVDANRSLLTQCEVARGNIALLQHHLRQIGPEHRKIRDISEDWLRYATSQPEDKYDDAMDGYDAVIRSPLTQQVMADAGSMIRILEGNVLTEQRLLGFLLSEIREAERNDGSTPSDGRPLLTTPQLEQGLEHIEPPPGFSSSSKPIDGAGDHSKSPSSFVVTTQHSSTSVSSQQPSAFESTQPAVSYVSTASIVLQPAAAGVNSSAFPKVTGTFDNARLIQRTTTTASVTGAVTRPTTAAPARVHWGGTSVASYSTGLASSSSNPVYQTAPSGSSTNTFRPITPNTYPTVLRAPAASKTYTTSAFVPYGLPSSAPAQGTTAAPTITCRLCGLAGPADEHDHHICHPQSARSAPISATLNPPVPPVTATYGVPPPTTHIPVHRSSQAKPNSTQRRPLLQVEPLKLDKFSGNISEWPGFWTQFDVAVDSQDYSDIEKINLLYQCLVGKAKSRVAGIPRSAENYAVVKRILCDACDRPDRLLKNLTEKLESLPVAKGTPSDLETFHVELESICRQLESMGHDVNTLSTRLAIQKRLPPNLLQRWMETSGVDESMWTTNFLRAKLRQQVDIQETVGSYRQAAAPATPRYDTAPRRYTTSRGITYVIEESTRQPDKNRLPPNPHPAPRRNFECAFCGRDHFSAKCDIYSSLQQRIKRASDKGLCTRCLRGKHASKNCAVKLGPCRECSRRHHIALCDKRHGPSSAHPSGQPASKPKAVKQLTKRATFATVTDNETEYSDSDDYWRDNYLESDEDGSVSCDEEFDSIEQELEAATAIDDETVEDDGVDDAHDVTAHNVPTTVAVKKAHKTESYLLAVASGHISKPNSSGRSEKVYILLDSCSSTTYISTEVATRLRLKQAPRRTYDVSVFGTTVPKAMTAADTTFDLHLPDGRRLSISAEVVPHIVGQTATYDASDTDLDTLRHMNSEFLPTKTVKPDILIGTKHLYKIGFVAERQCLRSGFTVVNTDLGPVVTGHGNMITNLKPVDSCNLVIHDAEFEADYRKHMQLEIIGITPPSKEESNEEVHHRFQQDIKKVDGRMQVRLPWKVPPEAPEFFLKDHRQLSWSRFQSEIKKIQSNPAHMAAVKQLFDDLEQREIISRLTKHFDQTHRVFPKHYFPYRIIIKQAANTSKLRPVYDASARQNKSDMSLNDCMFEGPVLLNDLVQILLRVCLFKHLLISDIEKAFLQILLDPRDRHATRFFFLADIHKDATPSNVIEYIFNRVPFGVNCGPYLCLATIYHHLANTPSVVSKEIPKNIYVDNIFVQALDEADALHRYREILRVFDMVSMPVREFVSTFPSLNELFEKEGRAMGSNMKLLGMPWDSQTDLFTIKLPRPELLEEEVTRRMIVSENSSLWDPMGRLTPVALVGRLLTQETYDDKLGWDSPANPRTTKSYFDLVAEWNAVGAFTFPRRLVSQTAKPKRLEVHTFVDASNVAYACATYLRLLYDDHVSTDLFFAKSRVKPENGLYLTIPRMELLAMLVGVRSTSFVLKAISEEPLLLKPDSVTLWGDNQGVLYWINSSERQSAWVEHRLREIRGGYEQGFEFRYVPTLKNPADIASRGCYPKDLLDNDLWWHGPKYLQQNDQDNWPEQPPSYQPFSSEDLGKDLKVLKTEASKKAASEFRATLCLQPAASTYLTTQKSNLWLIRAADRSSWSRLISTTARVLQFIAILARNTCPRSEFLKLLHTQVPARHMQSLPPAALDFAEKYHIRQAQRRHRSTMNDVKNLELFKDSDGIYRCRSRIVQSEEYSQHPIYLPRDDAYTQLLLLQIHQHNSHCDQSTLIVKFRQRYFIPRSKNAASTTIRQCLDCRRYLSGRSFAPQKWADQPIERVQLTAPFTNIGLDYGGPFVVRLDSTSKDTAKRWICIFTCMSVRAIHLEVAKDLTADTFMRILDKFIARRTRPAKIWSDNATTFTAVEKVLRDAVDDLKRSPNLSKYLEQMRIDWCHITPENPQQGGFYERLVGTVKRCLKATIGNKKLLADDFECLVTKVERVINERPLVNVSDADTHPTVLRPIDFIRPSTSTNKTPFIPDKDDGDDSDDPEYETPNRKSKESRQLIKLRDDQQKSLVKFTEIWNKQYLLCLADQYRKDLKRSGGIHRNPIAGEAVFVKPVDDNVPRREWKLARIVECRPGEDGVIRTAQMKQANGTVTERSVTQLYPVEISL